MREFICKTLLEGGVFEICSILIDREGERGETSVVGSITVFCHNIRKQFVLLVDSFFLSLSLYLCLVIFRVRVGSLNEVKLRRPALSAIKGNVKFGWSPLGPFCPPDVTFYS